MTNNPPTVAGTTGSATRGITVLLLGRTAVVVDDARAQLAARGLHDVRLLGGTSVADVRGAFATADRIDHVIMGAGLDLNIRLQIVREVFTASDVTCVHLKDSASGPAGFLAFVAGILAGLHQAPTSASTEH